MMTTRSLRPEPITLIGVDVMRIALPRFAKSLRAFVSTIEDTVRTSAYPSTHWFRLFPAHFSQILQADVHRII